MVLVSKHTYMQPHHLKAGDHLRRFAGVSTKSSRSGGRLAGQGMGDLAQALRENPLPARDPSCLKVRQMRGGLFLTSPLWLVGWQHADLNESGGLDRVELEKLLKEQLLMWLPDQDNDVIFSLMDHSSKSLPLPLQVFSLFPFRETPECDETAMRCWQVASRHTRPLTSHIGPHFHRHVRRQDSEA